MRAQRQVVDQVFDLPQAAQRMRKDKPEIRAQNLKAALAQKSAGLGRRQEDGVAVELATRHHVARGQAPRAILPKGKKPSRAQRPLNQGKRFCTLRRRDVVEHPVAVGQVHLFPRLEFVHGLVPEICARRGVFAQFPETLRRRPLRWHVPPLIPGEAWAWSRRPRSRNPESREAIP